MVCVKTSLDFSKSNVVLTVSSNLEALGIAVHGFPHLTFTTLQPLDPRLLHTLGSFSITLDYAYCLFEMSVREAALEAIPQSKRSIKIAVLWWNKQYDIAGKTKKHAFN